jgi:hypothetical protein
MRLKILMFVALSAACAAAADRPAYSQTQAPDQNQLRAFFNSDSYKGVIHKAFAAIPPAVFQICPGMVSNSSSLGIIKPISFGADGAPNAGLWKQSFPVSGCGDDVILNFIFSANADGKINSAAALPGTTRANMTLQRDGLFYANIGAAVAVKDCKNFVVKNTKFEGYGLAKPSTPDPGPNARFRPWWETWTMFGCNHAIDVPMDFTPDATGTNILQVPGTVRQ